MALIPGSYARAAGLQSEINKVTVTRVAGSEVQFRRIIDTYQKDLRFNVRQIGREQRLLRRSLKKYSKKLLDSKKERTRRQAKVKEDSDRLKQNVENVREADQSVDSNVLIVNPSAAISSLQDSLPDVTHSSDSDHFLGTGQHQGILSTLPDSPDSGVGSEVEETVSPKDDLTEKVRIRPTQKTFLTSQKGRVPYLKARRGNGNKHEDKDAHKVGQSCDEDYTTVTARLGNQEEFLPIINEESEEVFDQLKFISGMSASTETAGDQEQVDSYSSDCDKGITNSRKESPNAKAEPLFVTSLDTKSVRTTGKPDTGNDSGVPADFGKENNSKSDQEDRSINTVILKKPRRKMGVSYGDLIKLQHTHTSSTKQLFKLVDRLASVHGIVDPPPLPSSSTPSSLDPRSDVKIKHRGKQKEFQMSDGIVKQAAVLYSIKYGYNNPSSTSAEVTSPVFEPLNNSDETTEGKEDSMEHRQVRKKKSVTRMPDIMSEPGKHSTLSVRRESMDVTSPFYEFSEAASSIFDDLLPESVSPSLRIQERQSKDKPMTLTELSVQATKVRERTLLGPKSLQDTTRGMNSQKTQHRKRDETYDMDKTASTTTNVRRHRARQTSRVLSSLPRRSRSLSRQQRDNVKDQLQRRLNDEGESGNMAWQSAFGRLKMLHTLYDLSQHFSK